MHLRHEPAFDLPPCLIASSERRLSERALALWQARRIGSALPAVTDIAALWPRGSTDYRLVLGVAADGAPTVIVASAAIAAVFALDAGPLRAPARGSLHALVCDAVLRMVQTGGPTQFAATLTTGGSALLTRAMLLPLAGPDGSLSEAAAVISWREVLERGAQAALVGELMAALAARPDGAGAPPHSNGAHLRA